MIATKTEGRRTYLTGDTYPVREQLREAGAHWDGDRKAWWVGSAAKAAELVGSLQQVAAAPVEASGPETLAEEAREIIGRGTYKGRGYYVIGRVVSRGRTRYDRDEIAAVKTRDGSKLKLASRDGSLVFWAAADQVSVEKRYERLTSIANLRNYAAQAKANGGYVPVRGRDYCGYACPVDGHTCTADHPCHDCQP